MCGRFVNLTKINFLKKKFNSKSSLNKDLISYNISPNQDSYIIFKTKIINIEVANWGFSFIDNKTNSKKNIINSRIETIKNKILFKDSFFYRKCLIPLNGYYEWGLKDNIKIPYFIHIPPFESMYLAGIWKYDEFKKNEKKNFTIITKKSNNHISNIHHRMPVVLSINEGEEYINDNQSSFLKEDFSSEVEQELDFYEVSKYVNNPLNNSQECIKTK